MSQAAAPALTPALIQNPDQLLVRIAQVTSQHVGDDFFSKLCATLVEVFGAELAFVTRAKNTPTTRVKVLSQCATTALRVPEEFDLEGTPCELLYDGQGHIVASGVQRDFAAEKDNGLESFIGIPLIDSTLGIIGHLSVYSVRPVQPEPRMLDVIKVFANRCTVEIQRLLVEEERDRLLDRLESAYTALRRISTIDPESGALTRSHLDEIALPLMTQGPVALTLLRVDGLEAQRAMFGHVYASDALLLVAGTIQKLLSAETQSLARVADSYFAVLQKGANDDDAVLLAERLAGAVEETILLTPHGQISILTISAVGASPHSGENWVQFFGRALQALDAIDKSATAEIQLSA